jgi:hypothetical protein
MNNGGVSRSFDGEALQTQKTHCASRNTETGLTWFSPSASAAGAKAE